MEINTLYKKKILRDCVEFDINDQKTKLSVL